MAPRLWPESIQQATDQSNSQKLNSKQNFSGITTESLQIDLWQYSDTSASEKQNIDKLFKTVWVWNEIFWKKHEFISLLTENEALKEAFQVKQLSQAKATLIISYIN